jgi:DivIVA domain-containing protein
MAQLTADDVVLKGFQTTKFREGYDQVEVDDFLDEVALSMRALTSENEDLKSQLAAAEARIAELERSAQAAPGGLTVPVAPAEPVGPAVPSFGLANASLPGPLPSAGLPGLPGGPITAQAGPAHSEAETATGMLALANKLHEQYVRAGQEEGDQLIAESKAKAASIVREAEDTATRTKARLEQERADLEKEIESLRIFERDYRTRLRTYLKNLLNDIDGAAAQGGAADALDRS